MRVLAIVFAIVATLGLAACGGPPTGVNPEQAESLSPTTGDDD